MKKFVLLIALGTLLAANDIIIKESSCSVDKTVQNLKQILRKKGLGIFATINHQANAKMVGMQLQKSKMVIFGNPKMGTAFMQQDITTGLDLPLRVLVYRDSDGRVKMAYRDGTWLSAKHVLNAPKKVKKMNRALDKITEKAGQCLRD